MDDTFFERRETAMQVQRDGNIEQAKALYTALIDSVSDPKGRARYHIADTISSLIGIHAKQGDYETAITRLTASLAMFDVEAGGQDTGYVHDILIEIAGVHSHAGDWQACETALNQALAIAKRVNDMACDPNIAQERLDYIKSHQPIPTLWSM